MYAPSNIDDRYIGSTFYWQTANIYYQPLLGTCAVLPSVLAELVETAMAKGVFDVRNPCKGYVCHGIV